MTLRKSITFRLLLILFLLQAGFVTGLSNLSVSFFHNKLGVPFISNPFGDQLYPGVSLAGEFPAVQGKILSYSGRIVAKYSYHSSKSPYGTVFSLGTEFVPRFETKSGFYVEGAAGIHYNHVFSNLDTYRITDKGVEVNRDLGRPEVSINIGIGPGFDLEKYTDLPVKVFVRADMELLYAPSLSFSMLNILPATTLMMGMIYSLEGTK